MIIEHWCVRAKWRYSGTARNDRRYENSPWHDLLLVWKLEKLYPKDHCHCRVSSSLPFVSSTLLVVYGFMIHDSWWAMQIITEALSGCSPAAVVRFMALARICLQIDFDTPSQNLTKLEKPNIKGETTFCYVIAWPSSSKRRLYPLLMKWCNVESKAGSISNRATIAYPCCYLPVAPCSKNMTACANGSLLDKSW